MRLALGLSLPLLAAAGCFGDSGQSRLARLESVGLGVADRYMEAYVRGWAENDFSYRDIPHEAQAYELTARYRSEAEPFSVREEVELRFGAE